MLLPFGPDGSDLTQFRRRLRRAIHLRVQRPLLLAVARARYRDPDGSPPPLPLPIHYARALLRDGRVVCLGVWEESGSLVLPGNIEAPEGWDVQIRRGELIARNVPFVLHSHPGFDRRSGTLRVSAPGRLTLPGDLRGVVARAATDDFRATCTFGRDPGTLRAVLGRGVVEDLTRNGEADSVSITRRASAEDRTDALVEDSPEDPRHLTLLAAEERPVPDPPREGSVLTGLTRVRVR